MPINQSTNQGGRHRQRHLRLFHWARTQPQDRIPGPQRYSTLLHYTLVVLYSCGTTLYTILLYYTVLYTTRRSTLLVIHPLPTHQFSSSSLRVLRASTWTHRLAHHQLGHGLQAVHSTSNTVALRPRQHFHEYAVNHAVSGILCVGCFVYGEGRVDTYPCTRFLLFPSSFLI